MLARGVRNVIYNYTDAQRKVRSATSNDAWGPSPALMHEISDLTDNVVAYAEIMPIIWKRLNDHGKNWRHVYKSLVLLDHLIKYGNERVAQQCKENIFAIQTLKDFQYIEDQKDQGFNVREKAKQLVALLKDDERLRNERRKAQDARARYSRQAMGMDSTGAVTYGRTTSSTSVRRNSVETSDPSYFSSPTNQRSTSFNENLHSAVVKDFGQPTNAEEEQLQMQIALAESQREAEDEERRRKNDDLKLKIALERSVNETSPDGVHQGNQFESSLFDNQTPFLPPTTTSNIGWNPRPATHLGFIASSKDDPWSSNSNGHNSASLVNNDPWQSNAPTTTQANPWGETRANENGLSINVADPWGLGNGTTRPVSPPKKTIDNELSEFFGASATISTAQNPWNVSTTTQPISVSPINSTTTIIPSTNGNGSNSNSTSPYPATVSSMSRKTPESFLGDKFSTLVDLNQLVTQPKTTNPFGSVAPRAANPFANTNKPPTLEQLSSTTNVGFSTTSTLPPPLIPSTLNNNNNNNNNTNIPTFNTTNPFM